MTNCLSCSNYFVLPSVAVFAGLYGKWLPMHVKDIEILNTGLYSTLPDLLKCMNESRHIDSISLLSVLCIIRE